MKTFGRTLLFAALWGASIAATVAEQRFVLPEGVAQVVTRAESFARFVAPIRNALPEAGLDARLRLGMEAHLALNAREPAPALAAATALRALETDPAAKALAGLVTEAQVASWKPGADFAGELRTRLAGLPRTPEITGRLRSLREKIAATTREALLAEAAALGRKLDAGGRCDWRDADEIVRLHHRFANVLPLRAALLAALDEEIGRRAG
jgi:hypothetical protein